MPSEDSRAGLNSSQALHLLASAQHADKLLAEIEFVLSASKSKSPFRKYKNALSPVQVKVVEDYLASIRAQMVRVLAAQGIPLPEPKFESVHSIRVNLAFARIAFRECTPDRMRGYGPIPESKVRDLNGLVDEMVGAIEKLDSYLAQGLGQDLQGRLERLERSGGDVTTVKTLERIINDHGLVEFRSTLSMIIDRLESKSFEIALFGRVSSGKSSLLNSVVQSQVLPVGVNPITAVPTRLLYGPTPRLTVWYADKSPEQLEPDSLPDFVVERRNPANCKHVTRIVVELPSPRLRDGVVLVDTPGLGSLVTSGAAETLAYLPCCDLGIVLIDASSTLTQDDLSTIRSLYEAAVPVSVLLSKSDLLSPDDRARSLAYVSQQIAAQLGLDLPIHPVSVQPTHSALLENWLKDEILPLYERHQQLMQESLRRKIGALREAVETALRARLGYAAPGSDSNKLDANKIDARLRRAAGCFAPARGACLDISREVHDLADRPLADAASRIVDNLARHETSSAAAVIGDALAEIAAKYAGLGFAVLENLARELTEALCETARDLDLQDAPKEDDLISVLKEMPRLDLGRWQVNIKPSFLLRLSKKTEIRRIERTLRDQIGAAMSDAFSTFGTMLDAWAQHALADLQMRFDTYADQYRAHLDRLTGGQVASEAEALMIQRDLDSLTQERHSTAA